MTEYSENKSRISQQLQFAFFYTFFFNNQWVQFETSKV